VRAWGVIRTLLIREEPAAVAELFECERREHPGFATSQAKRKLMRRILVG